ncbi:MAG: hypothetical protein C5B47_06725 [Verrucomicrobia bacterium]|nr:MAG: hypothetical protein C5B47_06725 [Verrucomicrobiota bacterium]
MKSLNISVLTEGAVADELLSHLAPLGLHNLPETEAWWWGGFLSLLPQMFVTIGGDLLNGNLINSVFLIAKLEDALQKGLRIISLFAFIVATIVVMYGGYQIRTGNADAGKMSILGGLVIGLAIIIVTSIFEIADLPVLKVTK